MKRMRFLFVPMIAAVLLPGASLAQQGDHPLQPVVSQSGEKSADQQKDEVRNDKNQPRPKPADETQEQFAALTRSTTKRRPNANHSKPILSPHSGAVKTLTKNSPRTETSGSVAPLEQMRPKAATDISNQAVSRRSPSVPSSASVNGQRFKNSRDPGAHLAASGGRATIARGTAAINGNDMKRKP